MKKQALIILFQIVALSSCKESDLGASPQKLTTVAGKTGDVVLTTGDVMGLGTAAGLNAGNAANNVVQLDGTAKIPVSLLPPGTTGTLSGDVNGTSAASTVDKIKGIPLSIAAIATNQILRYNGTAFINSQELSSLALSGDISGTTALASVDKLQTIPLLFSSLTTNDILKYNGTSWVNAPETSTSAVVMSGDITSNSNTSVLSRIKGVLINITSLTSNDVLKFDGTNWVNSPVGFSQYAGEIVTFAGTTCPTGTVLADGSIYARASEPNLFGALSCAHGCPSGTTFSVPDLRGVMVRYLDGGTGRDPDAGTRIAATTGGNTGNNVGSIQGDAFASHTHTQNAHGHNVLGGNSTPTGIFDPASRGLAGYQTTTGYGLNSPALGIPYVEQTTAVNNNTGGNETRPKNVYMLPCIRRYNQ